MKCRLTDSVVAGLSLRDGENDRVAWDDELTGFGLRLRPGGKSWIVAYRPAGAGRSSNMKRLKLGTFEVLSAADARRLARRTLGQVAAGSDPLAERKERRRQEKSHVADLLDRYEADLDRRGYVNRKMAMATLRKRLGCFAARDIKTLEGAELVVIVDTLEAAGRPGAAADFRSRCSAFLSWCVVRARVIETNPLSGYRRTRTTRADRIAQADHGRTLSDEELQCVWDASAQHYTFGRLVRFLILTGCRRHEASGLRWSMIDRKKRTIRLPAAFVKQGRDHLIPHPPAVEQLLSSCPVEVRSDLVFPSGRTGGPISGWSKLLPKLRERSGVQFQLHDLRRTFRTGLSQLGIETDIAELALGHARGDLEAIYNRDDAADRLRGAFEIWATHVEGVVRRSNLGLFG